MSEKIKPQHVARKAMLYVASVLRLPGESQSRFRINIIRKKPQAARLYDLSYRGGRFNTHQLSGGATGPIGSSDRLLYRLDASYEGSDGWRDAGADRLNVSPSLSWIMSANARMTIHQTFNRDRFDGDGGVPFNITGLPNFKPELRLRLLVETTSRSANLQRPSSRSASRRRAVWIWTSTRTWAEEPT